MAITWGFIPRSSIMAPSAFGAPVRTSLWAPRSKPAPVSSAAASSFRSSATEIRSPPSDSRRISSRRAVVLPPPGREITSVFLKPAP